VVDLIAIVFRHNSKQGFIAVPAALVSAVALLYFTYDIVPPIAVPFLSEKTDARWACPFFPGKRTLNILSICFERSIAARQGLSAALDIGIKATV
jgi:hypothetical protein